MIYDSGNNKVTFGGDLELLRSAADTIALGAGDAWADNSIGWAAVSKTGSSLADLATRSYSDLTSRPADDDFNTLTAETSIADTDLVLIYDTSASAYRKMTRANFVSGVAPVAAGDTGQIQFNNSDAFAADAALFWDNTNKRLGIGTSTPEYGIVTAAENGNSNIVSQRASADAFQGGFIGRKARGTLSSPAAVQANDYIVRLIAQGHDGTTWVHSGSVDFVTAGAPATGYVPTTFIVNTSTSTVAMAERLRITNDGKLATGGEAAPDVDAGGLCLNHGANDGKVLTFKNSDVAHGFTALAEADTYGYFGKVDANAGGTMLFGFGEGATPGLFIVGASATNVGADDSRAPLSFSAVKSNGTTGTAALAATENLATFESATVIKLIIKGSGDIISDAGLKIASYGQTAAAGAVQWNGTNFQGYNGSSWVNLDTQSTDVAAGDTGQIQFNNSDAFAADAALFWDNTNKWLGIGTSTPEYPLEISGGFGYAGLSTYANETVQSSLYFRKARGTEASPTAVQDGDPLGAYSSRVYSPAGSWQTSAAFRFTASGTPATTNVPTKMEWLTNNGTAIGVRLVLTPTGQLATGGELAPDVSVGGLCLNQGSADTAIQTFKSSDVAHPFTTYAEADTYGAISKSSGTEGGLYLTGYSEGTTTAVGFTAYQQTGDTSDSGFGAYLFHAAKSDGGTGTVALGDTDNLIAVWNATTSKVIVKGSGDILSSAGLKISSYGQTAAAGAVQWNGTHFQGYNGTSWVNLDEVGSSIVAGSDTQIQFNNSGAFGASSNLTWSGTALGIGGDVKVGSTNYYYLGDPSTDGSWRFGLSSGDMVLEKRVSGVWELEHKFKG